MNSKLARVALLTVVAACCVAHPTPAQADPTGKSYTTLEFINVFGNWDCYRFEDDGTFISTYGLVLGEFEETDICLFSLPIIGCVFSIPSYEVTIMSPSNPVYTALDVSDFMASIPIIIGTIATDDPKDQGFFIGFESPICRYPARCCPKNAFPPAAP